MKTRSQKLISLVLVLMMLVTLIPMGMISANAAVSAELAAGLADIENTAEFVINNVDDWKAVAATNNQFVGKTIKLGADIDAQGEALPQLFMFGNVRCTFDGQGHTIKNVGTAETPIATSLFSAKSNIDFYNLTIQNVYVSGTGNKGLLVDWQNMWAGYTYKNIKVIDCSVTSTDSAAGAIIGWLTGNGGAAYVTNFENVSISGTSVTAGQYAGGLVGNAYFNTNDYGVTAKNVEITNTTITDNKDASSAAGLFGYVRMASGAIVTIDTCYVNATFVTPNSSGWTGVDTALFRAINTSVANNNIFTVKNCITNCTFSGIVQSTNLLYSTQGIFVTENLFAVTNPGKTGMLASGGNTVNGTTGVASNYNAIVPTTISADLLSYYITKDANGFITDISAPSGMAWDLQNYDSNSTFVIRSAEDWNIVAASGKNFSGKTIKLGANISDATLKPLAGQFYGTFDGAGYTLSNITNVGGLIASARYGTATTKNLTIDGLTVTGSTGALSPYFEMGGNALFQNIKITDLDIQGTGDVGGLIGLGVAKRNGEALPIIKFENIYLTGSVITTSANVAGGLIGKLIDRCDGVSFENVYSGVDVSVNYTGYGEAGPGNADALGNTAAGGFVGRFHADGAAETVNTVLFKNCVAAGTITSPSSPCGFVGYDYAVDMTLVNCIDAHTNNLTSSAGWMFKGVITALRGAAVINYTNLTVVTGSFGTGLVHDISSGANVNNTGIHGTANINAACDDVLKVDAATAEKMINVDANGFITMIDDHVHAFAIQNGTSSNGAAIRFIAKSQLTNVESVTMTIVATTAGGTVKEFTAACTLYDKLTAYNEYGVAEAYTAADYDAAKLAGLTIYGLPAENITFVVTTTYTTANGLTVTGTNTMTVNYTAQ